VCPVCSRPTGWGGCCCGFGARGPGLNLCAYVGVCMRRKNENVTHWTSRRGRCCEARKSVWMVTTKEAWEGYKQTIPRDHILADLPYQCCSNGYHTIQPLLLLKILAEGVNWGNVQICAFFALRSRPFTAPLFEWDHFCSKLKLELWVTRWCA